MLAWLQGILEYDLEAWRSREAAYLPKAGGEDKYLHARAREQAGRAEAELAVLNLYERHAEASPSSALTEDRTWTLYPVVRLLASGYRHRPGFKPEWLP